MLTIVALPALWLVNRDAPRQTQNVAAAGVDELGQRAESSTTQITIDPLGTTGAAFLDGPTLPATSSPPEAITPSVADATVVIGTATYNSRVTGNTCLVIGVPPAPELVVTNLDNGRSVTCDASLAPAGTTASALVSGADLVMSPAVFSLIAELTDAPVPVEISG